MATIEEDYVSFETAKLLKEKGFDKDFDADIVKWYNVDKGDENLWSLVDFRVYKCPSLAMMMKWLREVHKIHIIAEPCLGEGNEPNLSFNRWFWTILKEEGEYKPIRKIDEFSTYEQACEAAIKYCLENLI